MCATHCPSSFIKEGYMQIIKFSLFGFLLIAFVFLGVRPMFEKGPERIEKPNPSIHEWIVAAQKIKVSIEQMTVEQLQITSTAMQAEASTNLLAEMHDIFGNLKATAWGVFLVLLGMFFNFVFPVARRN